jgi:hypothetical protein
MGAATVLEILAATPPIKKFVTHPEVAFGLAAELVGVVVVLTPGLATPGAISILVAAIAAFESRSGGCMEKSTSLLVRC